MTRLAKNYDDYDGEKLERAYNLLSSMSAIGDFSFFKGTGFLLKPLHDTMQGSERIRHSILCKI